MGMVTQTMEKPPGVRRRPGRLMLIPIALLTAIGAALGYLFLTAAPLPSTPLGASALYPGGMAQIAAIAPLEKDGWEPPGHADFMDQAPAEGSHRVRLLVQLTALDAGGLQFNTPDFVVTGIGSREVQPLWSSVAAAEVPQGKTLDATLVFELPDQAIAMVLEGPDGTRLSLGLAHHGP